MPTIYKMLPAGMWSEANEIGLFRGSAIDMADGFIHFSAGHQVVETAAKHFAGQSDLLLLYVDAKSLGNGLKWEASRGGALFPHLYGAMPLSAVIQIEPLPLGADNAHKFPVLID